MEINSIGMEGVNSLNDKWDGIHDYKYHIVLENEANYLISEKLFDSYLGLSFPFITVRQIPINIF